MEPTARFVELVSGPEEALPLDEAWYLVSAHARDDLSLETVQAELDELAGRVEESTLDGVVSLLFEREGFGGNTADYYDPDNSFVDQVLERRRGIPLSLSMLTIEVARRVDVALDGVGMPGHFLVRTRNEPPVFVDPFGGGARLSVDGCAALFRAGQGPEAPFDIALLDPVGPAGDAGPAARQPPRHLPAAGRSPVAGLGAAAPLPHPRGAAGRLAGPGVRPGLGRPLRRGRRRARRGWPPTWPRAPASACGPGPRSSAPASTDGRRPADPPGPRLSPAVRGSITPSQRCSGPSFDSSIVSTTRSVRPA